MAAIELSGCANLYDFSVKSNQNYSGLSLIKNGKRVPLFNSMIDMCLKTGIDPVQVMKRAQEL
ncbi:MAG: hypothetical protein E6Q68_08470 [Polynucleobacter sp.]|nr:MAG: hypothetical protein E6Q68_08470 [Polynucleobacter sp.]